MKQIQKFINILSKIKLKADAKLDLLFLSIKQKLLSNWLIKKSNRIFFFYNKCKTFLKTNKLWTAIEPNYRNFEKKFHSIMDDLEQDLEKQRKQIFAQNSQEFHGFIKQALFYLVLGFFIWVAIMWFTYDKIVLYSDESFMPLFHTIRFPKSHIIRFVQFPKQLVDFNFRYYNPIKFVFKFDLTPKLEQLRFAQYFIDRTYRYPKKLRFVLKILPKNW